MTRLCHRVREMARPLSTTFTISTPRWVHGELRCNCLLTTAFPQARPLEPPDAIETCHFSLTTDSRSYILWVHWREDKGGNATYYMEEIYAGMLHHEKANERLRAFIRNLVDRVQEQRLAEIKKLLPSLKTALLEEYRSKPGRATLGPSSVTPSKTLPLFHPPALVSLSDSSSSSS
jgi:hypothetical protein